MTQKLATRYAIPFIQVDSIMKLLLKLYTFLLLALPFSSWGNEVGTTYLKFIDQTRNRPMEIRVWYPAQKVLDAERITYYSAFKGTAIKDAPYLSDHGRYLLIMLSHGDRGSHIDQSWLADRWQQMVILLQLHHIG